MSIYEQTKYVIDSGKEVVYHCPHESKKVGLSLCGNAVLKLRHLQEKFRDVEFLVYGNAVKIKDGSYKLDDIIIPEQVVGSASVDKVSPNGQHNTVIHKHPGNFVNFSSTDNDFINSNHDFSVVIGSYNLYNAKGVASVKVECGRYIRADLDVEVDIPGFKDSTFDESTKNIKVAFDGQGLVSKLLFGKEKPKCSRCGQLLQEDKNESFCPVCNIIYCKP